MATNLTLQLQVIEPDTDLNSIMIGNSNYNDDVWDLRPFITAKSTAESKKYIRFEFIAYADMKETVKQYAYYKLGKTKPQTVEQYINGSPSNVYRILLLKWYSQFLRCNFRGLPKLQPVDEK